MLQNQVFKRILFFCFFIIRFSSFSQNWLTGAGGNTNDEALDIASDAAGNYYVTGYFTTTATFGSTVLSSAGNSDIFIAKYDVNGTVQWAVEAGGVGADRAYSIKTDLNGNVFITGFYYGTATFGSSTITSVNNTQDVFIAKYDTSGSLVWVKSVGGSDAETGYGITPDNSGNVIVTGQFKGNATFGSVTLTSMNDQTSGLPCFNIFTTKFDSNGNFLWVEQGTADRDGRGLDVAVDDSNNVFVVGQFSDTIQFDVVHNNAIMNAGFLLKYDSSGVEKWFVKMSAFQTIVYSLAIDQNNNILITGDFKGNLGIFSPTTVFSNSTYANSVFVAKFKNSDGSVLWVENDGSDNDITSKSIAIDNNGDAYITGLFKCRFDEYSALYGTGIFYSSGYRDVFITKYSASGTRQWVKHMGSNKDDYCSGIAITSADKPIIAGSFENNFNVPWSPAFTSNTGNTDYSNYLDYSAGYYCSINNYQNFIGQPAIGQKDIFITSPVDTDTTQQAPFDYFIRYGAACIRDLLLPCINNCEDTVHACGSTGLYANPKEIDTTLIGAQFYYLWNTGSTTPYVATSSSGPFWLKSTRQDGCFQNTDTVDVIVHPVPEAPWITDSDSINVNQPPATTPIIVCAPDTITLYGTHTTIADSVYWTGPGHITINDSTIQVTETGDYYFYLFTQYGCISHNWIRVRIDTLLTISPVIDPHIIFLDSLLQATDTITICYGEPFGATVIDSGYYTLNGGYIPNKIVKWKIDTAGSINPYGTFSTNHIVEIRVPATGWYTLFDTIVGRSNACGSDTSKYPVSRSFYVIVNPLPTINLSITGLTNSCPGDTVMLYGTSNTSAFTWSGPSIIANYGDSIAVIVPSSNAYYSIRDTIVDTITGCSNIKAAHFILQSRPKPVITISPADGIVCPGDSVLLSSQPAAIYYWIGPSGDSIGTTQNIYVDIPGYYHCIQTAVDGCVQTSNFVEAKEFNSPYLAVLPGNHICANGNAIISVQASNSALIQWQAPLSGSAVSQTVSSPGTYICHITQCGITIIDSIVITQSNTPSYITGDSLICLGDTLVLTANSGMAGYLWLPGNSMDPYLYVTQPGTYTLQTTDAFGCYGFSDPFIVTALPQPAAPIVADTIICAGQSIVVSAIASDSITWYSTSNGGIPLHLGSTYITPVILNNTTYYVQTIDSVCSSQMVEMHVNVFTSSLFPSFTGDTVLCEGDSLILSSVNNGTNYTWTGPNGFFDTLQTVFITNVSSAQQGYYTLQYHDINCLSDIDSFYVSVNSIPNPNIAPDTNIIICAGTSVTLQVDSIYDSYSWFPGNDTASFITVGTNGVYYVSVVQNGCSGISDSITVSVINPFSNPLANDSIVCLGDTITLTASGFGLLTWYDSTLTIMGTGATYTVTGIDSSSVYFVQSVDTISGCSSQLTPVNISVIADSIPPNIFVSSPLCVGENIYLSTDILPNAIYSWSGPGGFTSTLSAPIIFSAQLSDTGMYQLVVSVGGCVTIPGTTNLIINPLPEIPLITGNTIYCEDDTIHLEVINPQQNVTYHWSSFSGVNSDSSLLNYYPATTFNSGIYFLKITENGCTNDTSFNITVNPQPVAMIYSNAPVCSGDTLLLYTNAVSSATYYWSGPDAFSSVNQTNTFFNTTTLLSGTYELAITQNNCISDTAELTVDIVDFSLIDLGPDTAFCEGSSVTFTLPAQYNYFWNDGSSNNYYTASDSGKVIVIMSAGTGCTATDSIIVDDYSCLVNTPNFMTPNGDGVNDFLYFDTQGARSVDCTIYDRWGDIIYEWHDINGYWDGKNLRNQLVNTGVYFYVVSITDYNNQLQTYRGFVQVQ